MTAPHNVWRQLLAITDLQPVVLTSDGGIGVLFCFSRNVFNGPDQITAPDGTCSSLLNGPTVFHHFLLRVSSIARGERRQKRSCSTVNFTSSFFILKVVPKTQTRGGWVLAQGPLSVHADMSTLTQIAHLPAVCKCWMNVVCVLMGKWHFAW